MHNDRKRGALLVIAALLLMIGSAYSQIELVPIGTYETGVFADGAAEINAYDSGSERLYVVNAATQSIDVLDMSDPTNMSLLFSIDITPYGKQANSVAAHNGLIAAAVENDSTQLPGVCVFFDTDGNYLNDVPVGALPDMLTFTKSGKFVIVANEGEPNQDYTHDPEGSVSIIKVKNVYDAGVKTADFNDYDGAVLDPSIRIFGPGATVSQDLEPEYITIIANTAIVSCQENNALAIVDIHAAEVTDLIGLGFKDYNAPGNGIDASNEDGAINIANWPVLGMYQPDALASYKVGGNGYIITANEGDSREYEGTPGFVGEERIKDLSLDPGVFGDTASLQLEANLGRLKVTITNGDIDDDGDYEELYSYGARSFSIRDINGALVYDSGDDFEQITAALHPDDFNSDDEENGSFDDRSDDKGPEPEGVTTALLGGNYYAFIGLERVGGIMVYDVTNPASPTQIQYINTRDFSGDPVGGTAGDLSPEGISYVAPNKSPNGKPLLVVSYEVSGTTTVFEIQKVFADSEHGEGNDINASVTGAETFALSQNYPNPFNPTTDIAFTLSESQNVSLKVYNTLGQEVKTLTDGNLSSGTHHVRWDGTDNHGVNVASGIYIYRLETPTHVSLKKMQLIR